MYGRTHRSRVTRTYTRTNPPRDLAYFFEKKHFDLSHKRARGPLPSIIFFEGEPNHQKKAANTQSTALHFSTSRGNYVIPPEFPPTCSSCLTPPSPLLYTRTLQTHTAPHLLPSVKPFPCQSFPYFYSTVDFFLMFSLDFSQACQSTSLEGRPMLLVPSSSVRLNHSTLLQASYAWIPEDRTSS